jgi:hypothetical protein
MRATSDELIALLDALVEQGGILSRACRARGLAHSTPRRGLAASREHPTGWTLEWAEEVRPFHDHVAAALEIGRRARYAQPEPPPRLPGLTPRKFVTLSARKPATARPLSPPPPVAPAAPGAEHPSILELRRLANMSPADRAAAIGAARAPDAPPRYVSMDERSEGIGQGRVAPGGMKIA